jgi:hypothetical protein
MVKMGVSEKDGFRFKFSFKDRGGDKVGICSGIDNDAGIITCDQVTVGSQLADW